MGGDPIAWQLQHDGKRIDELKAENKALKADLDLLRKVVDVARDIASRTRLPDDLLALNAALDALEVKE